VNRMTSSRWSTRWAVFVAYAMIMLPTGMQWASAQSDPDEAAIRDVITKFNSASEQAMDARDPTLVQEYTMATYYPQVAQDLQDGWDQGVVATRLLNLDWGQLTVTGDRATATTTETWAIALDDGTAGQFPPERNIYTLVREDGIWKIAADEHPDSTPNLPMT